MSWLELLAADRTINQWPGPQRAVLLDQASLSHGATQACLLPTQHTHHFASPNTSSMSMHTPAAQVPTGLHAHPTAGPTSHNCTPLLPPSAHGAGAPQTHTSQGKAFLALCLRCHPAHDCIASLAWQAHTYLLLLLCLRPPGQHGRLRRGRSTSR